MASEAQLWKWFSLFIRLRDADANGNASCFTCGRVKKWREMDCGHGVGRQHKAVKYSEVNNHSQCKSCNGFEGGRADAYMIEVNRRYGAQTWNKLLIASRSVCKRSQSEIDFMCEYYKTEAKRLSKEKNLPL